MSKKALFLLPITFIVISTASCSWLFGRRDYISERNPSRILTKRNDSGDHYISYSNYRLTGDIVDKVIYEIDYTVEYTYCKGTPNLNGKSFELSLQMSSFWTPSFDAIVFYESGYASTSRYDTRAKEYYTYYYQFDEKVAKKICELVDDEYEYIKEHERREQEDMANTKRDYEKMIESMDIHTIINKIKEEEITDMEFTFTTDETPKRSYTFTFRDDGSIYDLLNAATYGVYDSSNYSTEGTVATLNIRVHSPDIWSIMVDKQAKYIDAYYSTLDKYNRNYAKHIRNSIDDDSLIAIMNRAYELSAPTNPFGNSSSNPSSSSDQQA
ncbi:MAG: hypothetical protein J6I84_05400 [Bacilli bacterium]|nr:hypothetical protein [Bacilli bacterium]